jgi:hypothetical protein
MRNLSIICLWIGALPVAAAAAEGSPEPAALVYPCSAVAGPFRVDGRLDEPGWASAPPASGLTEARAAGRLASPATVLRAVYDDRHLYLGVRCAEPQMARLVAHAKIHDGEVWFDDSLEIFLDTHHDHTTYFQLVANSLGTRFERTAADLSWTAPWEAAAQREGEAPAEPGEADAWVLEVAIPFASLSVDPPPVGGVWGFNLCRERYAGGSQELSNWSDTGGNFHRPQQFGHLLFAGSAGASPSPGQTEEERLPGLLKNLLRPHPALQVCLADGFLSLAAGQPPQQKTYRELAEEGFRSPEADLKELAGLLRKPEAASFAPQVQDLQSRAETVRTRLNQETLTAEEWVATVLTSQEVAAELDALKWEIRLHVLLHGQ